MQRLGRLLYAVRKVCNARRTEMDLVAAAHAASASTEWTFDDLLAGALSPAAETSARLLAAAAAGQLSRQPGKGFQPMPVRGNECHRHSEDSTRRYRDFALQYQFLSAPHVVLTLAAPVVPETAGCTLSPWWPHVGPCGAYRRC